MKERWMKDTILCMYPPAGWGVGEYTK